MATSRKRNQKKLFEVPNPDIQVDHDQAVEQQMDFIDKPIMSQSESEEKSLIWLASVEISNSTPEVILEALSRKEITEKIEKLTDVLVKVKWVVRGNKIPFKEAKTVKFT